MNFLVKAHQKKIASGLIPTQVKILISLSVLCDASIAGLVDVYDFMTTFTNCELVKKVHIPQLCP